MLSYDAGSVWIWIQVKYSIVNKEVFDFDVLYHERHQTKAFILGQVKLLRSQCYLGLSINSFKCQITKMSNISFSFPFHVWRSNVQNLSLGLVAFEMGVAWQLHICTRTFRDDITNLEPLNKLFLISDHWSSTNQLRTISNNHVHHWSVSSWVWRRSGHSSWECNKHLPRAAKTRS